MRILGIETNEWAKNHLRVLQPLMKLRQLELADCLTMYKDEIQTEYGIDKLIECDLVVVQRADSKHWFDFIKLCQKHGKIVVHDYDDDPFHTHPMNPFYRISGTQEYTYKWEDGTVDSLWKDGEEGFDIERNIEFQDMFRACFRKADLVTTTTGVLADEFKDINSNVIVLPNLIDFDLYSSAELVKKEIRIGWQGGMSHYPDIYMIKDAIIEVMKKHDNVKFIFMGDFRHQDLFQEIPTSKREFHPWCKFICYPDKLKLLNLDIGLCPLVDNRFNRCKSSLKWLDYSAVKAATIASHIPPYSPDIKDDETGILVGQDRQLWVDAMDELITNKKKRLKIAQNAYDDVRENHNANKKAKLWLDAYEKVAKMEVI